MHLLRQSTTATVLVGPVLDSTGAAVTTAVVGDFRLAKEGSTAILSGATVTHDANGYYRIALTTGNTDTVGRLAIYSNNTAHSMGTTRFTVLLPSVYDALIANATNTTGGLATATAAITAFAGAISTFAGGAVASVTGAVGSVTSPVTVGTNNDKTNYGLSTTALSDVANAVWTAATRTLTGFGSLVSDVANAVWSAGTRTLTAFGFNVTVGGYATGQAPLQPTIAGRTLDVTATGAAGIDWGNVENQSSIVNLSATLVNQVNDVVGSIGEIAGITFPTHFENLAIAANGHVTATVDSINNNAITAASIQANALTAAKFAADSITATVFATDAAVEIAGKVWDEALSNHLTNGSTGYALNNAGGSGNPWITDLSTGYTGTQAGNILNLVKSKTDLITSGSVQTSLPVTQTGQITGPLFIGDDYLNANGRAFSWTVALPSGFVVGTSVCKFGMELAEGTGGASFNVTGTVIDAGGGNVTLRFDVPRATTETLEPGFYRWSVEIASASGNEVTRVASDGRKLVEWREKQT